MKKSSLRTKFTNEADADIDLLAIHLQHESPKAYWKIRETVFKEIEKLVNNPLRHPLDRFKKGNPGNYRAFEKCHYRVTYVVREDYILILRIRHNKQMPLDY